VVSCETIRLYFGVYNQALVALESPPCHITRFAVVADLCSQTCQICVLALEGRTLNGASTLVKQESPPRTGILQTETILSNSESDL
jgi:hypothetical protein